MDDPSQTQIRQVITEMASQGHFADPWIKWGVLVALAVGCIPAILEFVKYFRGGTIWTTKIEDSIGMLKAAFDALKAQITTLIERDLKQLAESDDRIRERAHDHANLLQKHGYDIDHTQKDVARLEKRVDHHDLRLGRLESGPGRRGESPKE